MANSGAASPPPSSSSSSSSSSSLSSTSFLTTLLGDPQCTSAAAAPHCTLLLVSKLVGLAILVLGSLLKLPSVLPVLRARSTRGIAIPPLLFETFGFTICIAFNLRAGNPFTTWGECPCLLAANLLMLAVHAREHYNRLALAAAALAFFYAFRALLSPLATSDVTLQRLLALTVPAFMTGTVLQIYENYRLKHIGGISPATLKMGLMCGLGRLLTTFVEVDDPVVRFSSVFGASLGLVLYAQMVAYQDGTRRFLEQGMKAK
ncbi:hypothetical protein HDU87_005350 [Geranomyces variabilis]|uniref:Mannose-P-dolichol utilization defect 1 protein homolog n=1 Tax=Geranomyces variabilis TaxID=109894 RepID=A0AAD5XPU4_9FUNG|nr:hypothetical protein HDU87_005350 [Geranomyces variabilis]